MSDPHIGVVTGGDATRQGRMSMAPFGPRRRRVIAQRTAIERCPGSGTRTSDRGAAVATAPAPRIKPPKALSTRPASAKGALFVGSRSAHRDSARAFRRFRSSRTGRARVGPCGMRKARTHPGWGRRLQRSSHESNPRSPIPALSVLLRLRSYSVEPLVGRGLLFEKWSLASMV